MVTSTRMVIVEVMKSGWVMYLFWIQRQQEVLKDWKCGLKEWEMPIMNSEVRPESLGGLLTATMNTRPTRWMRSSRWKIWEDKKVYRASLQISVTKESACKAGDPGLRPGSGRSPGEGNGNPPQYCCLENPMDRGVWQATVHGVTRVGHNLATKPPHKN